MKDEPLLKKILEHPWLLLLLGVTVPTLSYTIWGWIELWRLPTATLP